jgi:type IV secretory pathway VirB2 component (pilin)
MLKVRVWTAVVVALPLAATAAAPAHARTGKVCDTINWVCDKVAGPCLP